MAGMFMLFQVSFGSVCSTFLPESFWKYFLLVASLLNNEFIFLQIQLLLQYLKNDPRKAVKRLAIQDLKLLANKTPHTWSRENIQVCMFFLS